MLSAAILQKIFYINKQNNKIMKKIDFSKYYQRTCCETLTTCVYCRVVFLYDSIKDTSMYLVEALFKFSHKYKSHVCDDLDSAMKLYNEVIK